MIARTQPDTAQPDFRPQRLRSARLRFESLHGAHTLGEPERVGLVAAALASLNGVRWDGSTMEGEFGRAATARDIAQELGWKTTDAVTKSLNELAEAGVCERYPDGWEINAEEHGRRCSAAPLGTFKLDKASRRLNLPAPLLLFVGFVLYRYSPTARHTVLGSTRLGQITGWQRRTINKRAAKLVELGVLKRWSRPGDQLACYVSGPAMSDAHSERAHVAEPRSVTPRYAPLPSERAHPAQSEGPPDTARGPAAHSERAHPTQSEGTRQRDYQGTPKDHQRTYKGRTAGAVDHGGGGGSLSESRSPEAEKVEKLLRAAGFSERICSETADEIVQKRGSSASTWTASQLDELRADPDIRNPAGAFRSRLARNLHDPVNDRPAKPKRAQDHSHGAAIRAENDQAANERRAGDASYQRRRICAMHRGDRLPADCIADELGLPLSEVRRIIAQDIEGDAPTEGPTAPLKVSERLTERRVSVDARTVSDAARAAS